MYKKLLITKLNKYMEESIEKFSMKFLKEDYVQNVMRRDMKQN